jgi:hypothetical protein
MYTKDRIRLMLSGGDRRSIGRVAEVVALIERRPKTTSFLVGCLWDEDSRVCMRAADALEKISRKQTFLLKPHTASLLGSLLAETTQQEMKWHLAVVLPRLQLTDSECRRVADILQSYLADKSSIVKTFAMQGLVDLTGQCASLHRGVIDLIRTLTRTGTPAMRARGRKLLQKLEHQDT